MARLLEKKSTYTVDYPIAIEFAKQQAEIFWLPDEIEVEKDLHDLKTNFTEAEYHGVISTLKLFTIYELSVGNDYWQNYICQVFQRPDIQRMATTFSFFEIGVHAPFYNKINEVLGLDTDEFYTDYLNDPVLKNRMEWIGKRVEKKDTVYNILKSIGIFSMIEGAILYSSFAFLKHFNNVGKNKLINVNAGINFSVNDETCLSADTEVLTDIGWKNISEISVSDKVCQYSLDTKEINFVNPYHITSTESTESYVFESDYYHQRVTPNHRMIQENSVTIAELASESDSYIISGIKTSGDDFLSDEDKLIIQLIVSGEYDVEWIYLKIPFVSSEWAKSAVDYYLFCKSSNA